MAKMRFTNEEDEQLIQMVACHDYMWDMKHPDFKHTFKKDEVWRDIGKMLNKTRNECQKRWKSIRDHYRRQKKDENTGIVTKKRAVYWDRLRFLDNIEDEKDNFPNLIVEIHEKDLTEGTLIKQDNEENSSSIRDDRLFPEDQDEMPSTQPEQTSPPAVYQVPTPKRKRENSAIVQYLLEKIDDKGSLGNCVKELAKAEEQDEVDFFFKSIAMTVKKFRPELVTQTKMKVFQIVTDMDILNQKGQSANRNLRSRRESNPSTNHNS